MVNTTTYVASSNGSKITRTHNGVTVNHYITYSALILSQMVPGLPPSWSCYNHFQWTPCLQIFAHQIPAVHDTLRALIHITPPHTIKQPNNADNTVSPIYMPGYV